MRKMKMKMMKKWKKGKNIQHLRFVLEKRPSFLISDFLLLCCMIGVFKSNYIEFLYNYNNIIIHTLLYCDGRWYHVHTTLYKHT